MAVILDAFLEFLALGFGFMIIFTGLTIVFRPLGNLATAILPILFIALPFFGEQPWRAYILAFGMLIVVSFILVTGFNLLFSKK